MRRRVIIRIIQLLILTLIPLRKCVEIWGDDYQKGNLRADRLPGWLGLVHQSPVNNNSQVDDVGATTSPCGGDGEKGCNGPQLLTESPSVYIYRGFLSMDECEHLLNISRPWVRRPVSLASMFPEEDPTFLTYEADIRRATDPIVTEVEERIARWTGQPAVHQEDFKVIRHGQGMHQNAHFDDPVMTHYPRVLSITIYLEDDGVKGGETVFPKATEWANESLKEEVGPLSSCAAGYVSVKPRKGDAILWHNVQSDGTLDRNSLHLECPVLAGTLWTASKWVHSQPYHPQWLLETLPSANTEEQTWCWDWGDDCKGSAEDDGCFKDVEYMIGQEDTGACRLTCGVCEDCWEHDLECWERNRITAGYLPRDEMLKGAISPD